jgi:hypothetical protein
MTCKSQKWHVIVRPVGRSSLLVIGLMTSLKWSKVVELPQKPKEWLDCPCWLPHFILFFILLHLSWSGFFNLNKRFRLKLVQRPDIFLGIAVDPNPMQTR